jgi:histone acetyltransferase (RNA polymerase elongator complex component)
MGCCKKCTAFVPPEFMADNEECLFCEGGMDTVNLRNEKGVVEKYYKRQCVEDYKLFMRKLKQMPGVANALATKKVNFIPKGE